jgi:hypothetical protein
MKKLIAIVVLTLSLTACDGDYYFEPEDDTLECGRVREQGDNIGVGRYCKVEDHES